MRISSRYFIIELVTAVGFAFGAWHYIRVGGGVELVQFLLFALVFSIALVTFVIDLEHFLILDKITLFGVGLASVLLLALDLLQQGSVFSRHSHLLGGLFGVVVGVLPFFLLWYLSKGRWLGFGDVKYMAFMGITLGYPIVLLGMLFSFWVGALCAVPLLLVGRKSMQSKLPFGTFLALGQVIAFVYGSQLLAWYWALVF